MLVVALIQQNRFQKDKKRCRDADRYENNLRGLPYMGNLEPGAPTETTSLCPRATDIAELDEPYLPGEKFKKSIKKGKLIKLKI